MSVRKFVMKRQIGAGKKLKILLVILLLFGQGILGVALPVWADMPRVCIGKNNVVKLEVASSPAEIEKGLMYRTTLAEDTGMVFIFDPPRQVNFWMYHTLIPLDMCFVQGDKIIKIFQNVPPCHSPNPQDCPLYPGGDGILASEVIELKGGYTSRHNVHEGDTVNFDLLGH